ncbi:MAG: 7-cyano-7-deazaguanine synthase [Chloroflexi bacterium]|nr:7-cyano-7-deazaguanine synthase [Chloroflexota bacterium]
MTTDIKSSAESSVCVLASGGLDSAVLTWLMLQADADVQPVYVRTGMAWETVEYLWLQRFLAAISSPRLRPVQVLTFPLEDVYRSHWSVSGVGAPGFESPDEAVFLPGRNVILIAKTAVYCAMNRIGRIAIGVLDGNPFPDATEPFFDSFGRALSLGLGVPIRVERPLASKSKVEVLRAGAALPLELTFSCIRPVDELHCGDCNKCAERQRAFLDAGVPDRTRYACRRAIV